jgi:GTPase SAR1 family protein
MFADQVEEPRPLDTLHGLMTIPLLSDRDDRPPTQSSTFSNPASMPEVQDAEHIVPRAVEPFSGEPIVCPECEWENNTFLLEIVNYPRLQCPKERAKVLLKGEFDAVLLVYDIASRGSFETVADLHNEIPLNARRGRSSLGKRGSWRHAFGRRGGEIVVGLVGNKSDIDAHMYSTESDFDELLLEKEEAALEDVASEREVVHPLFRQSRLFDSSMPLSPISMRSFGAIQRYSILAAARRSIASADAAFDARHSIMSARTAHSIRATNEKRLPRLPRRLSRSSKVESWLEFGSPVMENYPPTQQEEMNDLTNASTRDSSPSTTAVRRHISRLEGELVARTLLLQVPFFETSAKTGQNVEELFEAVVKEVLKEAGRDLSLGVKCQNHKRHRGKPRHDLEKRHLSKVATDQSSTQPHAEGTESDHEKPAVKAVEDIRLNAEQTFLLETSDSEVHNEISEVRTVNCPAPGRVGVIGRMKRAFVRRPGIHSAISVGEIAT